jgi:hypothetical protein
MLLWNPKDGGHLRGSVGISGLLAGFSWPRVKSNLLLRACLKSDTTLAPFLPFPMPVVSFTRITAEDPRHRPSEAHPRITSC